MLPQRDAKQGGSESQEKATELEALLMRHRLISESLQTLPAGSATLAGARGELKRLAAHIRDLQEAHAQQEATMTPLVGSAILQALPESGTVLAYALVRDDLIIFVISGQRLLAERVAGGVLELQRLDRFLQFLEHTMTTI